MKTPQLKLLSAAIAVAVAAGSANAALSRMGPINNAPNVGGLPAWFQDAKGMALEFCSLTNQTEYNGGWCVLIPPGPVLPEVFPTQYFDEHFYYIADNGLKDVNTGTRARLVIALEAAFANGAPVPGDQMVFGRHRIFITNLPFDGTYKIITPYKEMVFENMKQGDRIFETEDIGTACIATFECALGSTLGPWLLPSDSAALNSADRHEVPPMPDLQTAPAGTDPYYDLVAAAGVATADPGTGKKYLADPARLGPITGSPMGNYVDNTGATRNHNTFRVEGPNGWFLDGEENFMILGRVMSGAIPGSVKVERASYAMDSTGTLQHVDVFARAEESLQPRLPAKPVPTPVTPVLSFYDAPCAGAISVDPTTLLPVVNPPPYTAPSGSTETPLAATGGDFWGQAQPAALPSHVCVKDATARDALGQVAPAYFLKQVTDQVTIKSASFDGTGVNTLGTLALNAVSTDATAKLTAAGLGGASVALDAAGNASASGLLAAPSLVQVVSSGGGSALLPVSTVAPVVVVQNPAPVASGDAYVINEDTVGTFDVLGNDANVGGGTIAITQQGSLGVGVVSFDATLNRNVIVYTPKLNANGVDALGYTVTTGSGTSNQAAVTVNITPVNDAPTAVNSSIGAVVGKPMTLSLIAKATDPDGNADVTGAFVTSWPPVNASGVLPLGAQPQPVGGSITFTPNLAGTYLFNFQVQDAGQLVSANTATGTVTVAAAEGITFTKSIFVGAGKIGGATSTRWTVTGADTVKAGQTLTIAYLNGTSASGVVCNGTQTSGPCVIGTAVVDAAGNYALDKVGTPGGALDPNDATYWPKSTKPTNIRVFSSSPVLGGANTIGISFK